ncbi:hypothetical protein LCGC14_0393090 [marine sediment metagenome]|uniref:Uncharacterized protein n=1 Tax=marine sediment metagenome TaxID=412755 RepID=A0A0F9W823_9ZZZZ
MRLIARKPTKEELAIASKKPVYKVVKVMVDRHQQRKPITHGNTIKNR